ncbi:MAG: MBOAT family protein [Myxococcales bacterium]|nr:MBOAT family protein [Myxococcales bacterium]
MLFPTVEYGIFFLCVFAAAWGLARRHLARKWLLLAASYVFYAAWDWRFLPLLGGTSLLGAAVARVLQLERRPAVRRVLLGAGVTLALSVLFFFKYLGFAAATVGGLLAAAGSAQAFARLPEVALPVGVSFIVFHVISLMVDAYRERIPVRVTLLDSFLYVAFFPQLVAGPILRAASFLPQLCAPPSPAAIDASRGLELIAFGLAKKVLLANLLATRLVDPVFEAPGMHSGLEALLAVYGYAAQIYCDFSGYTDIAIGSALLLGYRFPENFRAPYLAANPREFWHRWHISLSSWLRDYLFIPLGGSRGGRGRTLLNLAVTMLLGGLWHGAGWTFVLWGALHGLGLIAHRLWSESALRPIQRLRQAPAWKALAIGLTFHFVCLGWVLFRAPSLEAAGELLASLGGSWDGGSVSLAVALAVVVGVGGQAVPLAFRARLRVAFARMPLAIQGLALALAVLLIEAAGPKGIAPFIYFQF